ncbi:hypothetical protein Tco_1438774 [Tanacetum coccineum]
MAASQRMDCSNEPPPKDEEASYCLGIEWLGSLQDTMGCEARVRRKVRWRTLSMMLNQLIATRVAEALAAAAVTHAASSTQKRKPGSNSSRTSNRRATTRNSEKTRVTKGNGTEITTTLTTPTTLATSTRTNAQRQQGCLQPDKVITLASYPTTESVDDTTLTHALLLVTTVERQDIRPKTAELHLIPQTKEDQEAKEDREVMSLVSDVVKKDIKRTSVRTIEVKVVETKFEATNKILRTIKGKIRKTLKGRVTKHQPATQWRTQ